MRNAGIAMVVIGLIMMLYTGFTYFTTERVVDVGPIKIDKEQSHPVRWSPIVGGILFVGGIALVVAGKRKGD